jgi:CRISPR-associated endoribonuclease Cas6
LISYQCFDFCIRAKDNIVLPAYKGSTFRGGFGNAFRRVVCALKKTDCAECILKEKCVYSYVFETPPPADTKIMTKYTNAPHPFVIEPPMDSTRVYKTGEEIHFNLILIGKALDYLPYFVYTFDELGKMGIGKGRAEYELMTVRTNPLLEKGGRGDFQENNNETIYDSETKTLKTFKPSILNLEFDNLNPGEAAPRPFLNLESGILNLSFITPTRIIYDSGLALDLEFHILIRNLLRRLSLLYYFHCNGDPSAWDFRGMIEKAKEVKVVRRDLKWYDWERYSARQDTRMKMGGFVGEISFEGDIAPFMPLIKAGEVLHVGKGTGFGLGQFKIQDSKFGLKD